MITIQLLWCMIYLTASWYRILYAHIFCIDTLYIDLKCTPFFAGVLLTTDNFSVWVRMMMGDLFYSIFPTFASSMKVFCLHWIAVYISCAEGHFLWMTCYRYVPIVYYSYISLNQIRINYSSTTLFLVEQPLKVNTNRDFSSPCFVLSLQTFTKSAFCICLVFIFIFKAALSIENISWISSN